MRTFQLWFLIFPFLHLQVLALNISASASTIEHTPLRYAGNHYYDADVVTVINGSIANLQDTSIDLAANAVTQGLKYYVNNTNYRLIGIVVEVAYRLVANKAAGITKLADLRGKRIGVVPGTSSEVFVHKLLASAGVSDGYTIVNGTYCLREPCASNSLPVQFGNGTVDAFGAWEPSVELGVRALGVDNVILFENATAYREVYSLYSTKEKLRDPHTRQKIVKYIRALDRTYQVYKATPEKVDHWVAQTVGVDLPVLRSVWKNHVWGPGRLDKALVDFIQHEDEYLARVDKRRPFTRAELERFVDTSVYKEARRASVKQA
ncbi:hypothetical protein VTJ83DRAFT_6332 [Remersonia thermophila]|uniref:SsuA/THI5-like domain-containing protein n=1 Tax=Remersonia thermophila TaxID=72144 RepID=A0ABR4D6P9_9PEZI